MKYCWDTLFIFCGNHMKRGIPENQKRLTDLEREYVFLGLRKNRMGLNEESMFVGGCKEGRMNEWRVEKIKIKKKEIVLLLLLLHWFNYYYYNCRASFNTAKVELNRVITNRKRLSKQTLNRFLILLSHHSNMQHFIINLTFVCRHSCVGLIN